MMFKDVVLWKSLMKDIISIYHYFGQIKKNSEEPENSIN